MARFAIIDAGRVINVAEASAEFANEQGWVAANDDTSIGDLWDGIGFSKAPPPPTSAPQSVTMRQARLALLSAGLLDEVDTILAAIPDATQRRAAQIEWEFAATVDRGSAITQTLAVGLVLSESQLDDLFTQAEKM